MCCKSNEIFFAEVMLYRGINSKINGTPKNVYLLISKLHSILAVANLLAHKNYGYVIMGSTFGMAKIECSFEMGK